jgi:molecular chaperone DnaJ
MAAESMTSRDLYEVLGVKQSADQAEIKKAYKRLARKFHPDVNPGDKTAEEKFKEVSRAFEILSDEDKRKVYDELGEEGEKIGYDPEKAQAYRQWSSNPGASGRGGAPNFNDLGFDFDLGDLFNFGSPRQERSRARPGPDVVASMTVTFERSVLGGEEDIQLTKPKSCRTCKGRGTTASPKSCLACGGTGRLDMSQGGLHFAAPCSVCNGTGKQAGPPCTTCGGSGMTQEPTRLKVRIPPGVKEGQKIRLAGQGAPGKNGGPAGDLLISVSVAPHKLFTREGQDLLLDVPITVGEAMLGAEIEIPTLVGSVKLRVPPGSQSGQKLRLKGKGVPEVGSKPAGYLYAILSIHVPKGHAEEVKTLASALDELYDGDVRAKLK